ncbi:MAG: hypothetical protein CMM87_05060 [Rickettsiales bacterium]|nr:hypothetical protein [Rickettsiales bacterium]|tara:strand:- start:25263 stop:26159 length:897 start_codon:yes stop_codon:yes gene_type:complete
MTSIFSEQNIETILKVYPALLALGKHRNYEKAAQEIGLSESGLRAQIDDLEREIGEGVFIKIHQKLFITPLGEQLIKVCQNYQYNKNILLKQKGFSPKILTVQLTATTEKLFGADIIDILIKSFPDYSLQIRVSESLPDFSTGEIDMALNYFYQGSSPDIDSFTLTRFKLLLYASQHYLDKSPPLDHAEDLKNHELVGYQGQQNSIIDLNWFTRLVQPETLPLNFITSSTFSLISMIKRGVGIGSFASHVKRFARKDLVHVLPQYEGSGHTLYWMYNKRIIDLEKIQSIINPIRSIFN